MADDFFQGGAMALVGLFGGAMTVPLPIFALGLQKIYGVFVGSLEQLRELIDLVATKKVRNYLRL